MKSKKGQIQQMVPFALAFIVVVIVVALGGSILGTFQNTQITSTAGCGLNSTGGTGGTLLYNGCQSAYNITSKGLEGIKTFGDYMPVMAIVLVITVIVGILLLYLYNKFA